jgi:hypothetical protein
MPSGVGSDARHPNHNARSRCVMAEITVFYDGPIVTRQEAKALELHRYFTGKPCKHGHIAQRYMNTACVECTRARDATDHARSARRNWQIMHPDRMRELIREATRRIRKAHPELVRDQHRRSRNKHLDKRREAERLAKQRRHDADPEGVRAAERAWRKKNPAKIRLYNQKARARRRGAISIGSFTGEDEAKLLIKQKGKCPICAVFGRKWDQSDR